MRFADMTSSDHFKADMVQHITLLRADMDRATAALALLKGRVDEQLRCVQDNHHPCDCHHRCKWCHCSAFHSRSVARSNHASSMLSMREIAVDYVSARRCDEYVEPGSCGRAAHEALVFFDQTHALMRATVVKGVLFSPSGGAPLLKAGGRAPGRDPGAFVGMMRPFVLHDGCIWQQEEGGAVLEPDSNAKGFNRYVTLVSSLEGSRVAVDWSMGQFVSVPADLRLYLP